MEDPNLKGAIAETRIAACATELGIGVLRPIAEHGRYDLAFDIGRRLLRVQCKWAAMSGGAVVVRSYSCRRTGNGMRVRRYTPEEIDGVAAYCAELRKCYFLSASLIDGHRHIHLRVGPAKNNQRAAIHQASAFEFAAIDWGRLGAVAQLEERSAGSRKVGGSNPPSSTSLADSATIGSHEFRNRFGYHLERAAAGSSVVITRHGRPFARLGPLAPGVPEASATVRA